MPQYDDPLWTIIALAIIVLGGIWAYNPSDKPSGTSSAGDSREPEIGSPPSDKSESAINKHKAENGRDPRSQNDHAIRKWTAVLAISGVFAALFAAFTLSAIRGQLEDMLAATARAERPHLVVSQLHIWDKGKGRIFNPHNPLPTFGENFIQGAAFATNVGNSTAIITGSICLTFWHVGPLSMNHPAWDPGPENPMKSFQMVAPDYPFNSITDQVRSGEAARCSIEDRVQWGDFYIIGAIIYTDKTQRKYHTLFSRRYNRTEYRFEASTDKNYESED
jgi:hypothetical protein